MAKAVLGLGLCKWRSWETPLETFTAPVGRATRYFSYKYINNLFMQSGQCLFNSSFHDYNTKYKHKLLEGGDIGLYRWFSLDVIAAMLVHRTIEKKSFGNLTLLLCKIRAIICYCFVHQHGRLITLYSYFYPVLQCIFYCNIHIFKALVFILITYNSLA